MIILQKGCVFFLIALCTACVDREKVINEILDADPDLVDSVEIVDMLTDGYYMTRDREFIEKLTNQLNDLQPLRSINHPHSEGLFECTLHTRHGPVSFRVHVTRDQGTFIVTYSDGLRGLFLGYFRNDSLRAVFSEVRRFKQYKNLR